MEEFDEKLEQYLAKIEEKLPYFVSTYPANLYSPVSYVLEKGGKRIRPIFTLAACELFSGDPDEALDAAIAIEFMHNFTLIHDDIMDNSDFRRGKPTIHKKWDLPTAVLSGDVLAGLGFKALETYSNLTNFGSIYRRYVDALISVCEGQALDILFNSFNDITEDDYFEMIAKKTASLFQASLTIGGLIAGALEKDINNLEDFGKNLGFVFQIQDDLLDLIAEPEKLGKKVGLDLLEKKKTLMVIRAKALVEEEEDHILINKIFSSQKIEEDDIINFDRLFRKLNIYKQIQQIIESFVDKCFALLGNFPNNQARKFLEFILNKINVRSY